MSSPGPMGGPSLRPIGRAAPVKQRERVAANNTRDMGLKVLFSFDDQNTNCLARWPDLVNVRTAAIDERTVIGVVELRTCLQAVLQSSPELVSKVGQDCTVYAYDYSEPDVPQSGQGMLSWALAAGAPSQLVTGRVCKNVLGLFSAGVEETLEVKLRLVSVITTRQNEYLNTVEKPRQQGNQSDNNEWNTLVNSQPGLAHMQHTFSAQTVSINDGNVVNREEFNHIVNPRYSSGGTRKAGSRASTPTNRGNKPRPPQAKPDRPSSAASTKRPRGRPPKNPVPSGNISGSEDVVTDGDDGPPRKRVRPSEAEYGGNSAFGDPESLRIQASTAASIRGDLRPKPANPAMSAGQQDLPRAPTPVPKFPPQMPARGSILSHSSLRRESLQSTGTRPYASPYSDAPIDSGLGSEQIHLSIESAMTSPERRDTPAQTPQDITSSPPVLTTGTRFQSSMPPPSSPILPQMPRREDSTYGGSGGLFGDEEEDDDICLIEVEGDGLAARRSAGPQQPSGTHEVEAPINRPCNEQSLPPHKSQSNSRRNSPRPQEQPKRSVQNSRDHPAKAMPEVSMPSPPTDAPPSTATQAERRAPMRAASFGSLTMSSVSAGDTSFAPPSLARSQTAAPQITRNSEERADSENPTSESLGRNFAKKNRIVNKLEHAIANGQLPDFCSNCGAIETPTWRKAFTQDLQGDPGFIEYSDEPGRIMAVTILARDNTGKATSFRVFKKSLEHEESFDDFTEVMLCNPCGLWVSKYKSHRPPENWSFPNAPAAKVKKGRVRGKRRMKNQQPADNTNPTSEAYNQSEAPFPSEMNLQSDFQSEANFPQSEAPNAMFSPTPLAESENERVQSAPSNSQPQSERPMHPPNNRPSPTGMTGTGAINSTTRSSHDQPREGDRHSPVQREPEFGTTRRLLFPSPRKDGSPKLLGGPEVIVRVPSATSFRSSKTQLTKNYAEEMSNKENYAPTNGGQSSSVSALFGEESPARPKTPPQSNLAPNPFKTPTRLTPTHRPITRSQSKSASARKSMLTNQSPSKTPTRTPRRSPRHQPEIETPMTYINRIFSQPDIQIDLAAMGAQDGDAFGDVTSFPMPDMDMDVNFDLFEDPEAASYVPVTADMWNEIEYEVLGGHGESIHDNEDLDRILNPSNYKYKEDAANASQDPTSGADSKNQGEGEETAQEGDNDESSDSNAKKDEDETNEDENKNTQDDTKEDEEVPQM